MTRKSVRSAVLLGSTLAGLLVPAGCARTPGGASTSVGTQIIVTMTMQHQLRSDYFYYVLFNVNNKTGPPGQTVTAPIPVVAPPYGNGFAAGAFVAYAEYHAPQPDPSNVGFYTISPDLLTPAYQGVPQNASVQNNGATLVFQIPLSRLASAAGVDVSAVTSLQINFVSTNVVPLPTDTIQTKYFDALGNPFNGTVNSPITISSLTQARIYRNTDPTNTTPETSGDVAQSNSSGGFASVTEPDLDITDWTVEVRT